MKKKKVLGGITSREIESVSENASQKGNPRTKEITPVKNSIKHTGIVPILSYSSKKLKMREIFHFFMSSVLS